MARLRKASPLEPRIFVPTPKELRPSRPRPRKTFPEISDIISADEDEENDSPEPESSKRDHHSDKPHASPAIFTSSSRKQRIARPVKSNDCLVKKLSFESLASSEKQPRLERRARHERCGSDASESSIKRRRDMMFMRSLARNVVGKDLKRASSKVNVVEAEELQDPSHPMQEKNAAAVDLLLGGSDSDEETSIICGNEADIALEVEEQHDATGDLENPPGGPEQQSDEEDEEGEDAVIQPNRQRQRRRRQQRCIDSDSESEYEEEIVAADKEQERQEPLTNKPESKVPMRPPHKKGHSTISNWAQEVLDSTESSHTSEPLIPSKPGRAHSSSFVSSGSVTPSFDDAQPFLVYSPTPTKKRSPRKAPPMLRPTTPTFTPRSHTKLVSPSKKKPLSTGSPDLRPSLDAFWNPEVVNDWNDRHSPVKRLVSPSKQQWRDDISKMMGGMNLEPCSSSDEAYTKPVSSRTKETSQPHSTRGMATTMPKPTIKGLRAQRKDFDEQKHEIATSFLAELDNTICSSTITKLSQTTGGIKLIWSKTLKTTAGRANWRREVIRLKTSSTPPTYTAEIRHHCSIELASKVIDDLPRLYNVLAHEFCHLLTFMVSEVRNNPHGAEFKAWGRKVSTAFAEKGVEVTTKHSYTIDYKFIWECVSCGYEFKRHSRSVDTKRHSCGKCKGTLVQTKPAPRTVTVSKNGELAKKNEYQAFVKENFGRIKQEMAGNGDITPIGKVMEVVARQYRESKNLNQIQRNTTQAVQGLDKAIQELSL